MVRPSVKKALRLRIQRKLKWLKTEEVEEMPLARQLLSFTPTLEPHLSTNLTVSF